MGFWERSDGDVLGDGPADLLVVLLTDARPRPKLSGLLAAATVALEEVGPVTVEDPERLKDIRLRARFDDHPDVVGAPPDRNLIDAFEQFLFETQEEYVFALDRKPTLREILSTMRFCLRGEGAALVDELPPGLREIATDGR